MATNNNNNPGTDGDDSVAGSSTDDTLTGGLGNDTISGGGGNDVLYGDGPYQGAWLFETFDNNFSNAAGQAFDIEDGTRTGVGYVTEFDVRGLTQNVRDATGNQGDYGVIYTNTIDTTAGGTYTFATRSDDGSTIQIFDSNGVPLTFDNGSLGNSDFLNNDFAQSPTTRSATVDLDPNETYTIQIRFWENQGGDTLSATVSGPDTGGVAEDLADTSMLGDPVDYDEAVGGLPTAVEGDDTIIAGPGDDTVFGNGGNDIITGGDGDDVLEGNDGDDTIIGDGGEARITGWTFEYYDLPETSISSLTEAGFTQNGGRDHEDPPTQTGTATDFTPDNFDTGDFFALKFETELTVDVGGTYTFATTSDDGSKLFIDGVEVVSNDGLQAANTETGTITLTPGTYTVEVIYFENQGEAALSGTYAGPDTGGAQLDLASLPFDETGAGDDTLIGGLGDDELTGGDGDDTFVYVAGDGADTISDFNVGNSGSISDDDQTNNDFVDLSAFYNQTTLNDVNNADADPSNDFGSELVMLKADAADGTIDGIIDGVDYSAEIGDINLTIEDGNGNAISENALTFDNTNVPCFCSGTKIRTADGDVLIEDLAAGDIIQTTDNGGQPLRASLTTKLTNDQLDHAPQLWPILIPRGSLGQNLPEQDLYVSRQHRMLVRSKIVQRMFDTTEVLVPAIRLIGINGIQIVQPKGAVCYHHLVFDTHQIVFANGAPSESFFPGKHALNGLSPAARAEFNTLFPNYCASQKLPDLARNVPATSRQKTLIKRIKANAKIIVEHELT
ncbi:MAG: Hint domain-containing protein [Pseudomonadota bacterium]